MTDAASRPFVPVRFAVLAVSDSRTLEEDRSGATLAERIEGAGHILADRAITTDDEKKIRRVVKRWLKDENIDVILTTGGTGFTGRDVTPDAVEPFFEKRMDGFAAVFHRISYEKIGTSTIQSRATAGLAAGKFIFCLPGSTGACKDAWDGILVKQFDYRQHPCNFVEIMPRLDEHLKRSKLRAPAKQKSAEKKATAEGRSMVGSAVAPASAATTGKPTASELATRKPAARKPSHKAPTKA